MSEATETGQDEAIAFLASPASYGAAGTTKVERIDTHGAIVFLVDDRAYKLKRAVSFSYLDFSTVAKREAACRAELALNRRTAPELYLLVQSIRRRADGSIGFDGEGEILDWVVVMRQFDQDQLFDRLAERGALSETVLVELSQVIAAFHRSAEIVAERGGSAAMRAQIASDEENLRPAVPTVFDRAECDALVDSWRDAVARTADLLDARRHAGKVRRCHGDLHLRNICLWHGKPTLFDCIEFSESIACIDVLYDLAFLLMDLRHRRLDRFANLVLNTYLDAADEAEGLAGLPLFLSLRAAIRAHTGIAAARTQTDQGKAQREVTAAQSYFAMAQTLLRPGAPRLVAIGGLSGTGKSTIARALAPALGAAPGARLLHSDAIRKRLFGLQPHERLPPNAYAPEVGARVYARQRDAAATVLRTGHSVIVDAVFARPEERDAAAAAAQDCGAAFTGLWLTAPAEVLRRRVTRRRGDMSDADVEVLEAQLGYALGTIDWGIVDASGTPEECLRNARAALDLRATANR
ncbi:MAG: Zeta toxin [Rhodospirillales bacterium]|nr:Zeta toxin [Rhodospirillales bacterium]